MNLYAPKFKGLLIVAIATQILASSCTAEDSRNWLQPVIDVHHEQQNVGLAAAIASDGTVVDEVYLGAAVLEHRVSVKPETRFQVMSITKAFVGAALIKSVTAGLVDLDAPIQTYLPDFPKPASGDITLRNLSAHTAGLPHLGHPDRKALYVEHFDDVQSALSTFKDLPLLHEPGAKYAYSSSGYTLIAAVLEAAHEKPFFEVLQSLILQPLGLESTMAGDVMAPMENVARNYSFVDIWTYEQSETLQLVPTWDFSYNAGGGNLVTTARDLVKFGDAFLKPGFFTPDELSTFYEQIDPEKSRWSYGWFVNETADREVFLSISGATPGVQAGLMVYPASGTTIAVLANAWGKNSDGGALVVDAPKAAAEQYINSERAALQ